MFQRRRAVAALSELVFYGAAQCMNNNDCIFLPSGFLQVCVFWPLARRLFCYLTCCTVHSSVPEVVRGCHCDHVRISSLFVTHQTFM